MATACIQPNEEAIVSDIDPLNQRLNLMSQMLRATGADQSDATNLGKLGTYNTMVSHCIDCHSPDKCAEWLKQGHENSQAPGFCPNAHLMNNE